MRCLSWSGAALLMHTIQGGVELGGALNRSVTSIGFAKCETEIARVSPAVLMSALFFAPQHKPGQLDDIQAPPGPLHADYAFQIAIGDHVHIHGNTNKSAT